eukprot:6492280-Amphidinium_carterae.8
MRQRRHCNKRESKTPHGSKGLCQASKTTKFEKYSSGKECCFSKTFEFYSSWQDLGHLVEEIVAPAQDDELAPATEGEQELDEAQPDDSIEPLVKGAEHLEKYFARHAGPRTVLDTSEKSSKKRAVAAAECTAQMQALRLISLLHYAQQQIDAGEFEGVAFIEHVLYDETPLRLRVTYHPDTEPDTQKAKVWVVERDYTMILKRLRNIDEDQAAAYLCLRVHLSPAIQATENGIGETVRDMLAACCPMGIPSNADNTPSFFKYQVRVAETDEGGNNNRAERLLMSEPLRSKWAHLWASCCAHKLHTVCKKTWSLPALDELISGIKHASILFQGPGVWSAVKDAVEKHVDETLEVHPLCNITPESQRYKAHILNLCSPQTSHPRKHVLTQMLVEFLNADWRGPPVHLCHDGCCLNAQESKEKLKVLLRRFLTSLRPRIFSDDNWTEWGDELVIYTLGAAIHKLLPTVIIRLYGQLQGGEVGQAGATAEAAAAASAPAATTMFHTAFGEDEVNLDRHGAAAEAREAAAAEREQMARSRRRALAFFSSNYLPLLFIMLVSLRPQLQVMHHALHQVSYAWEAEQHQRYAEHGLRCFRMLEWHKGIEQQKYINQAVTNAKDPLLWNNICETEEWRTIIMQTLMRPIATVWALLYIRTRGFPYSVFSLLKHTSEAEKLATARTLLATPRCMRDSFGKSFLETFNTEQLLLSECARQVLTAIATITATTTFSTERLHSRNSRRARHRVHTHVADLRTIALAHMGFAGPSWAAPGWKKIQNQKRERKRVQHAQAPQKARRGGGGAFRAFQHHHLQGRRWTGDDMKQVATAYRQLTPRKRAHWEEIGRAGGTERRV